MIRVWNAAKRIWQWVKRKATTTTTKKMPVAILSNTATATASKIQACKDSMDVAKARGATGARVGVSVQNFPFSTSTNLNLIDTQYVTQAIQYADSIGLTYIQLVFGAGPKISQVFADTFYNGALWSDIYRPPQGSAATINGVTYSSAWDYIGKVIWQQLFDAAWNAKGSLTIWAEKFNESDAGGANGHSAWVNNFSYSIGDYVRLGGGATYISTANNNLNHTPPNASFWTLVPDGTIESAFWSYANGVDSVVNWRGVKQIGMTTESSGTTVAQREIDSITGATATTYWARQSHIHVNMYGDAPVLSGGAYNATTYKAAFSVKLNAQFTRIAGNGIVGALPRGISECGLNRTRCPNCAHPNTLRSDIIAQCKTESIASACNYIILNPGNSPNSTDFNFFQYDNTTTPMSFNNSRVAMTF